MARPAPGASLSACRCQKTHPNLHTAGCRWFPWLGASYAAGRWLRHSTQPTPPSFAVWQHEYQSVGMPVYSTQLLCPQMLMATAKLDRGPSLGRDLRKPTARVRGGQRSSVQLLAISAKPASDTRCTMTAVTLCEVILKAQTNLWREVTFQPIIFLEAGLIQGQTKVYLKHMPEQTKSLYWIDPSPRTIPVF